MPDHSSLMRIRARYGLEVFRRFFDAVVEQCQRAGLVWGQELYFDATQVLADASLDSLVPHFAVEGHAALQAHLGALFSDGASQDVPLPAAERGDAAAASAPAAVPEEADGTCPPTTCSPIPLPVDVPEPVRETLAEANAARHDWFAAAGRQQREVHGLYQRTADFRISTTDPDATPLRLKGGGTHLGYQTRYVVDGGKRRIILGVLVTPGEVMENQPMLDLAWHVRFRFQLWPHQATDDTTYGTLENITALEREGIRAYVPLPNWEHQRDYYGPRRFTYDVERDVYVCPQGQLLQRYRTEYTAEKVEYRADPATCNACPLKAACTPSEHGRAVHRHFEEAYLDRVRAYHEGEPYAKAMRKRKLWVEPLFAEGKQWHRMRRFRLRRLWRVSVKRCCWPPGRISSGSCSGTAGGRRPFPSGAAAAHEHRDVGGPHLVLV